MKTSHSSPHPVASDGDEPWTSDDGDKRYAPAGMLPEQPDGYRQHQRARHQ